MNESYYWEMFKVFAKLHPVEAYDLHPENFYKFIRLEGYTMTKEQIKGLINDGR